MNNSVVGLKNTPHERMATWRTMLMLKESNKSKHKTKKEEDLYGYMLKDYLTNPSD